MFTDVLDHNRVDMRVWLKKEKRLFTVEICTPYDEKWQKNRKALQLSSRRSIEEELK